MSRIAFVSNLDSMPWGGSEELWSRAALQLRARGHDVVANIPWHPQPAAAVAQLQAAGIEMEQRRLRERYRLLFGERYTRRIYNWLNLKRPDLVVISLTSQNGSEWMQACSARGIPYVVIVQSVIEHLWPGDAANLPLADGYSKARQIFYLSRRNLQWLQTQFARELPQATRVFNPFNVSWEARPAWPRESSVLRLACVGRLDPTAKGHDLLFRVLRAEKWQARELKVSLFGGGGYEKSLRALCDYYELENVEFAGQTSDIESIWTQHHALVLPSRFEGLPLVVVEAMLCGLCIVTDAGGNAELIEDNLSGFVAAAPKAEFLDEALERAWAVWKNGELQEMGKRAAIDVRGAVPADPAKTFADQLESIL